MNELRFNDWVTFLKMSDAFDEGQPSRPLYYFRGQAQSQWSLAPRLLRLTRRFELSRSATHSLELEMYKRFRGEAHRYIEPNVYATTTGLLGWWSLMQHHGVPTRLLDWTRSFFVAAYFAVEKDLEHDGAIWVASRRLGELMNEKHGTKSFEVGKEDEHHHMVWGTDLPERLWIIQRPDRTERMIAQQGLFTLCARVDIDHSSVIGSVLPAAQRMDGEMHYAKFIIPARLKPVFLRKLRGMNIHAASLFPGLDGIGRSMLELMELECSHVQSAINEVIAQKGNPNDSKTSQEHRGG